VSARCSAVYLGRYVERLVVAPTGALDVPAMLDDDPDEGSRPAMPPLRREGGRVMLLASPLVAQDAPEA